MGDKSMTAQGTVANQATDEAQGTITHQNHYSGGNALLDEVKL